MRQVVDLHEATRRVVEYLAAEEQPPDDKLVLLEDKTRDLGFGWMFVYGSQRFRDTGDFSFALPGCGPLFVHREHGSVEQLAGNRSPEVWEEELRHKHGV